MKHYGIPLRTSPGVLHVAIPAQRGRVPDAIGRTVVHRVRGLALPEDTQPPVAQVEQALICFMRCADELDALIALDAALRLGYTTRAQLESALPGPRNASLRSLLSQACPGARSLLETIARHDLEQAGYRPVTAVMVDGVGEVDLVLSQRPQAIVPGPAEGTHVLTAAAYPALLIETDGYTYHSSRPDWHSDHLRDQAALARGHTPLRLTSNQVVDRETVRIVSSVARRLGIHPDVTPGDF